MTYPHTQFAQIFKKLQIPDSPPYNYGFLEIIGKQTHENIWSKLYSYFLTELENDDKYPFLDALCHIIEKKSGKKFTFGEHIVETEVATSKGRVDILISDRDKKQIIIIENKVYHYLNNDLEDYWNYFKAGDEKKVGIVLALNEKTITPSTMEGKFISITHNDWIEAVMKINPLNIEIANQNIYLRDFIHTIKQTTKNMKLNEQSQFFFENAAIVNRAIETRKAAEQFLSGQYESIASKLGLKTFGNSVDWKNFWDEAHKLDVFFTLVTTELLAGKPRITIIIELIREPKAKHLEIIEHLKNIEQFKTMKPGKNEKHFLHFACRDYELPPNELESLDNFVVNKIKSDFAETFKAIALFCDPNAIGYDWYKKLELPINQANF